MDVPQMVTWAKDLGLLGALVLATWGVLAGVWVPGRYYRDALARAERAEAALEQERERHRQHFTMLVDATNRAISVGHGAIVRLEGGAL